MDKKDEEIRSSRRKKKEKEKEEEEEEERKEKEEKEEGRRRRRKRTRRRRREITWTQTSEFTIFNVLSPENTLSLSLNLITYLKKLSF